MRRLCSAILLLAAAAPALADRPPAGLKGKPEANPEATKLLADARAARATWENFPGFTADVAVNIDGKVSKGRVEVSPKGKVTLKLDDPAAQSWARHTLDSIVGHRLDNSASLETPCAFVDDNTRHPLGRAIRVLNDEFHSSYRIRGREVVVVNRNLPDGSRFTITVTESRPTDEKKFLPACFVVNSWDKSGVLKSSQAHRQTWTCFGKFDLPAGALVVTSTPGGKQEARRLTLSHHKLAEK